LNAAGNPVEVRQTTEWTYDAKGNKLTEKDPLGNISRWTYNSRGQVLTETDALGNTATYTYDKRGNLSSIEDAAGNIVKYEVNARGDLTAIIAPNGGIMKFEYDEFGNQKKVTDPLGNVTTATFYANGNIKTQTRKVTTPTGEVKELVTTWTYDNEGRQKSITDAEGRTTEYKYDERGLRTTVIVEGVRSPVLDFFTPASDDDPDTADGVMYTLQSNGLSKIGGFWGHTLLKAAGGYWDVAGSNEVNYQTALTFNDDYFKYGNTTAYRHDLLMSTEEEEQYKQNFQQWVMKNALDENTKNRASYDPPILRLEVPYDLFFNNCVHVTIENLPDSVKAKKELQGQWLPTFMHFKLNWLSHKKIVKKLKTREPGSSS
jgi:YD repeat-containing protein